MQTVNLPLEGRMFYCPVTGVAIYGGPNGIEASPAMLVMFSQESGEFDFISSRIEAIDAEVNTPELMENEPHDRFERIRARLENESNLVHFVVHLDGMATGPVQAAADVVIDLNYQPMES